MNSSIGNIWSTLEGEVVEGKYHLRRLINSGGFGGVFEADEVVADKLIRQVAVKLIAPDIEVADRQILELSLAASLDNPNILRCFSPGQCNVSNIVALYMVMELASGSLSQQLVDHTFDAKSGRAVLESVLGALIYLGELENPLVHRDVKPDNILLVGNKWKLADFGLLRGIGPQRVARTQNLLGTAEYAPPEAFDGVISPAWDMWSLGIVMVEMMTGKMPFEAPNPRELVQMIHSQKPKHVDEMPEPFRSIAMGCLHIERNGRLTAEQALDVLRGSKPLPIAPAVERMPRASSRDDRHRRGDYPFRFKFGAADTLGELIDLCEAHPFEAQDYLLGNFFPKWFLDSFKDPALAKEARQLNQLYWQQPMIGVELLMRTLCAMIGRTTMPEVVMENDRLDFGLCSVGSGISSSLRYKTRGRGFVWGTVRAEGNLPGLVCKPFGADGAPIVVQLDASNVSPGHYEGAILIEPYGCSEPIRVPTTYTVTALRAKVSHKSISFTDIPHGEKRASRITVSSSDSTAAVTGEARVFPPTVGMEVTPSFSGTSCEIDLTVDAAHLEAGREYVRRLRIESNGGNFEVPIRFKVAERPHMVLGYVAGCATVGAMVLGLARSALDTQLSGGSWVLNCMSNDHELVFRVIGTPIIGIAAGFLFRSIVRRRWPLLFEEARRPAFPDVPPELADANAPDFRTKL